MKFDLSPAKASLDQLCQRECAFAICRSPHTHEDQLFMQEDGQSEIAQAGDAQMGDAQQAAAFMIAPFSSKEPRYLIREERQELPDAGQFKQLRRPQTKANDGNYTQLFRQYHEAVLPKGEIKKLVLARCEDIAVPNTSPATAYEASCQQNPHCFCALIHHPQLGTWICATPELLLRGSENQWESMALAGTQKRGASWSQKNREEHQWVCLHSEQCLENMGLDFTRAQTATLSLGDIEHLCTSYQFTMAGHQLPHLLRLLPPTPAVCGYPLGAAKAFIEQHPDIERGCYAGYLGLKRPSAKTELYVTLRCMQLIEGGYRLYAGGGIMPESTEEAEMAETQLKMGAMARVIAALQD